VYTACPPNPTNAQADRQHVWRIACTVSSNVHGHMLHEQASAAAYTSER